MAALVVPDELVARRERSATKLDDLKIRCEAFSLTEDEHADMALFVTGSLGRREIGSASDLDVFLVDTAAPDHRHGNLSGILLRAKLIEVGRGAGFDEFSGDGRFLVIHDLHDLVALLGTREEDSRNVFTARMLLMLESVPLMGKAAYAKCVDAAVEVYSRDSNDEDSFHPHFLINDIVRYWKTLCLAYESSRHELHDLHEQGEAAQAEKKSREGQLDLLKLRFNRLWMCFNGLAYLLLGVKDESVPTTHVREMIKLSPLERAERLAAQAPGVAATLQEIVELYAGFLTLTDGAKPGVLARLDDKATLDQAHEHGKRFGDLMDEVVTNLATSAGVRRFLLL